MKLKVIDRTPLAEPWHEHSVDDANNLFRFEVQKVFPKKMKKILKELQQKNLFLQKVEEENVEKFYFKNQHIMTHVIDENKLFTHIKIGG